MEWWIPFGVGWRTCKGSVGLLLVVARKTIGDSGL